MSGSIRARGRNSWELRVYAGTHPETGQRRQVTRTVRGSRTEAQRELRSLVALANVAPTVGARTTLGELLERWFAASEPNWAATTCRSTRSIIDCQLKPKLGHMLVQELQTVMIDDFYASLRVRQRPGRTFIARQRPAGTRRSPPRSRSGDAVGMDMEQSRGNGFTPAPGAGRDAASLSPGDGPAARPCREGTPGSSVPGAGCNVGRSPRPAPRSAMEGRRLRARQPVVPTRPGRRTERAGSCSYQDPPVPSRRSGRLQPETPRRTSRWQDIEKRSRCVHLVAKRRDSRYRPGLRSRAWTKTKHFQKRTFALLGWLPPHEWRQDRGCIVVGIRDDSGIMMAGVVESGYGQDLVERLPQLTRPQFRAMQNAGQTWDGADPLIGEVKYVEWSPVGGPSTRDHLCSRRQLEFTLALD
jgi:hypothetical protein